MSEYQYYEFRALDRPLTDKEMAELRAISTRATITPTSFQNVYNYGDFRGDSLALMRQYFDAFLYVANWGYRRFMLRFPPGVLPAEIAQRYTTEERGLAVHAGGENVILEFKVDEEQSDWIDGEGILASLLAIRDDIARGDLRALYIAWLSSIWEDIAGDEEDDDLREPPVPPGLKNLTAPLRSLVDFLGVDPDLVTAAAEKSEPVQVPAETAQAQDQWLRTVPVAEKDAWLLQVMQEKDMEARAALLRRFRQDTAPAPLPTGTSWRTMNELLALTEEHRERRVRREREKAARERERKAKEAAAAREKHLADLATRKPEIWTRINSLLETRRGPEYEQATRYVADLREIAQCEGTLPEFTADLQNLRRRHAGKAAFIRRLDAAGL